MLIYLTSDTHTYHHLLTGDILDKKPDMIIHAGDESNNAKPTLNLPEAIDFFEWYSALPVKYKIYVPGNHSLAFFNNLVTPDQYPDITFLVDKLVEIEGIKIYGTPWTPSFGKSWAYMRPRHKMAEVWKGIPECDILVSHGMPKGILDLTEDFETGNLIQVGCKALLNKVLEVKPKIFIGGHLHSESGIYNNGCYENWGIKFYNASCFNHKNKEFYMGKLISI